LPPSCSSQAGIRSDDTLVVIGYRSLVTHTYEFRSANGELTPWESEQ
jgi:hypothetical protein